MASHFATIEWSRNGASFTDNKYSRGHTWSFDGGARVPASSSPHVVPAPYSVAAAVDPEEALVASLSSCHMLTFLYLAQKRGFVVDSYRDEALGTMGKNAAGKAWVATVTLHPDIAFGGERRPTAAELDALHHAAHEECFIANSVKTDVRVEPAGAATAQGS